MSKENNTHTRGFANKTKVVERNIAKVKKELLKLKVLEKEARTKWTKSYHDYMKAASQLSELRTHGTQKELKLISVIKNWNSKTIMLTEDRDNFRKQIEETRERLIILETELTLLKEQELNEIKSTDEIVAQVFELNAAAVQSSATREDCLNRHVFPLLLDDKGNLRSQITFTSSDERRRVVAMVNTMTIIRGDLAGEAKRLIQEFFDRFQTEVTINDSIRPLYELTQQLLIEKTDFKVGPDLYRFLSMELDSSVFPELAEAQSLLRQSIRSEKTNSYIRIYKRESRNGKWEIVPQS